ncbi:MAG: hypothetical protein L6R41_001952 [Letrouitia leprolyta]|nr:MAG: hypothetical protein L6R41_001952 [Letrouitia leprolyta]
MCIIERFHLIHPNGFREPRQRLRHCQFGTPITPCNNTRAVNVVDEVLGPARNAPSPPHFQLIEPRTTDRQRSPEHKKKPKKFVDDLKLVFDFHIPFTSRPKKPKAKPRKDPKKDTKKDQKMAQPGFPGYFARPLEPQPLPPHMVHHPQRSYPRPSPPPLRNPSVVHTGGQVTPPITVYSFSSSDSSPSPISPVREHRRQRPRSVSFDRHSEERNRIVQEQLRRERAERKALEENAARLRAERDADRVREERDRERRHNEELRAREERRQIEEAAERERRRRSQEQREREAQALVARRRREEEDRRLAIEFQERQLRREATRRREEEERQWRRQEEQDRLERQRALRIPRAPRHVAELHHHHHHYPERDSFERQARDNFEHRGDEVLNEAIRARFRDAELGDLDGGPRRRRTIGGAERRIYDDIPRRFGPRLF